MGYSKKRYYLIALMLAAPATVLYITFLMYPVFETMKSSFFSWNGIAGVPPEFVGLKNYISLMNKGAFWIALKNSFIFIAGSFIVELPISFAMALIITEKMKGGRLFKFSFFLPNILPITAVGLMWAFLLYPEGGAVNTLLSFFTSSPVTKAWLGDMKTSIYAVMLVNMWIYAGYNMLILAAGLTSIPTSIYEAAEVDGANWAQRLFKITIPMMKQSLIVFSILAVTGSLRTFDIIFVMTGGGPNGASHVPATLLYNEAFRYNNYGIANSIGTIILALGILFSIVMNRISVKER